MSGIVGYGVYIPLYRIKTADIAKVWGEDTERIEGGLGIKEKAVGGVDEDAATIAVEAARNAMARAEISPQDIGALYVGSESHPYAVKPTGTIVAEALGATPNLTCADLEFACKAGTAGIQITMGMVDSKMIKYGMAIGADTAQGRPGDALEYSAASGGAAFIVGPDKEAIATLDATFSFTTDTPDFWRRQHADYPSHGGRFTGAPAYFRHVEGATRGLLEKTKTKVDDYDHVVFHQPNAKFPLLMAKKFGIPKEKMVTGLLSPVVGNTYSGASMLGLSAVLDIAEPGDKILVTSFGSGAGGDSFAITVTDRIKDARHKAPTTRDYINKKHYIDYATYIKFRKKLKL
ncbi:hydroxymethylglutaryl-CoA synthase [Candidatus Micrarchaeota archaeon]|nr:hydroxymethylglutaryl-CoA synthase [Candidatus Micrarchaeota archaeon]MBU1165755.1 hydroxymethylglutaryl-CoA synthase [Candidatus Micrarchaeota archaeon]MBU1887137.1 hydroxymethylglutaryl-CoA synthase [Candidatus Micrarchaeota archaeon]